MSNNDYKKEMFYAMQIGEDARKRCEDKNIIDKEKLILELKDLKNILEFYGGSLKKDNIQEYSISKVNDKKYDFIIYYALDKLHNSSSKIDNFKILTGLGEVFLGYEMAELLDNSKYNIEDLSLKLHPLQPDTFARAFIMPKDLFLKETVKNTYNCGKINASNIAKVFQTDVTNVIARGNELQLFK